MPYVRGLDYLDANVGSDAAAEFRKIFDNKGSTFLNSGIPRTTFPYPRAQLGLARAYVLMGDTEQGRQAYEELFELWKEADPDVSTLIEAKNEYGMLN